MLKRIANFDTEDWKHIWWLFKNMLKQFFIECDFEEAKLAWLFITMHFCYDSHRKDD